MLAVSGTTLLLFVHILAATLWVGGQLTLAVLVPVIRKVGGGVTKIAAARFNQVAWPAFAVLIITGVWVILLHGGPAGGAYRTTLIVKLVVVAISGVTALLHARARSKAGTAVFGALTGVSALAALFIGVELSA